MRITARACGGLGATPTPLLAVLLARVYRVVDAVYLLLELFELCPWHERARLIGFEPARRVKQLRELAVGLHLPLAVRTGRTARRNQRPGRGP